jgi:hypothetical protein
VPLSGYGQPSAPLPGAVDSHVDTKTPVREQVDRLDVPTFFGMMTTLMVQNPPAKDDKEILGHMAKIGLVPGKPFDMSKLSAPVVAAIARASSDAREQLKAEARSAPMKESGWLVLPHTGRYGTDYPLRALVAAVGLGASLSEDAVYPVAIQDSLDRPFDGSRKYVLHFEKGLMPPVRGPWSVTMYDDKMFFVDNPLNRYALGQHSVVPNADGSVDVLIQPESPGPDREANWLPSRPGRFVLMLRLYWPNERAPTILNGSWKPPPVRLD